MPELQIRAMRAADLEEVFALQCRAYPAAYHEPAAALASRLAAGPSFCLVARQGGALAAYLFAHPWRGAPPALHRPLNAAGGSDHVFLHDMAVAPEQRGLRCGVRLHAAFEAACRAGGASEIRLVAVGAAEGFWQTRGFVAQAAELPASYGAARLMTRVLA
ncbi:MAG: GNAT family N-acetyltransferase [Candidatus Dactylopiibacterium sp.]|nr:GNAT family N-acetyltransferase [Candidatus Dactylopiibacterium sp.]